MADPPATYLRLHVEEHPDERRPRLAEFPELAALCEAFTEATGWKLSYEPPDEPPSPSRCEGVRDLAFDTAHDEPLGRLLLSPHPTVDDDAESGEVAGDLTGGPTPAPRGAAFRLAKVLGDVLSQWSATRRALWEREAELAAGVPVGRRRDETEHLAARLRAVLRGAVDAVGAQAAALYLLDDATSCLKLRASVGLPADRLLAPPRPLRGSLADLEALLGHAVVLEDAALLPHWRVPEADFPAAVCVPVSSPTTPLGTLWVYSDTPRDFSSQQTNMLEIVAGRIASDLERELLLAQQAPAADGQRLLAEAARWRGQHAPNVRPLLEGWDVAGFTSSFDTGGGELFDWSVPPDGRLAAVVASIAGAPLAASLTAALVQGAIKAQGRRGCDAHDTLEAVHDTLWSASSGGPGASLAAVVLDPLTGELDWAVAGRVRGLVLGGRRRLVLRGAPQPLGLAPEPQSSHGREQLRPGETLLLVSRGVYRARRVDGGLITGDVIAHALRRVRKNSASDAVDALRRLLADEYRHGEPCEQTVLAIRRAPRPRRK